ncbi:MAG: hypothetical protein J2P17_01810, partial [Mycobacterium sp.]|nr:hypothetical protein [Mycobacterium sp.]
EELGHAARFRHELFRSRSNLSFDENAERRRDEDAILVNLVLRDGIPVSTARCIPYPSQISPLTWVIDSHTYRADSEVGRIAAVAAPESAVYALLALTLGALWVLENSDYTTYISYVHPKLVRRICRSVPSIPVPTAKSRTGPRCIESSSAPMKIASSGGSTCSGSPSHTRARSSVGSRRRAATRSLISLESPRTDLADHAKAPRMVARRILNAECAIRGQSFGSSGCRPLLPDGQYCAHP